MGVEDTAKLFSNGTLVMGGIEIGILECVTFTCNEFILENNQNESNAKKLEVNFQRAYDRDNIWVMKIKVAKIAIGAMLQYVVHLVKNAYIIVIGNQNNLKQKQKQKEAF